MKMIADLFNMNEFKYHSIEPNIGKNWNRRNKINKIKEYLINVLALMGIVLIWLLCVVFVIGIFYSLCAVPTHFIIEIINAIKA